MIRQLLIIGTLASLAIPSFGEMPRKQALANLDMNAESVLKSMDDNAENMAHTLIGFMADPVGDQPKVLEICEIVINRSQNPRSVYAATSAVGTIIHLHRSSLQSRARRIALERVLQAALSKRDLRTRLSAARAYRSLGAGFENKTVNAYAGIFKDVASLKLEDDEKVEVLLEMLDLGESTKDYHLRAAMRDVSRKHFLVDFLRKAIKTNRIPGSPETSQKRLRLLEAISKSQ